MNDRGKNISLVLKQIMHPLLPMVSIADLGLVRNVTGNEIFITPFPSSGLKNHLLENEIKKVLPGIEIIWQKVPPYSTDWITNEGQAALLRAGITPPNPGQLVCSRDIFLPNEAVACAYCKSLHTEKTKQPQEAFLQQRYCKSCGKQFSYFVPQ